MMKNDYLLYYMWKNDDTGAAMVMRTYHFITQLTFSSFVMLDYIFVRLWSGREYVKYVKVLLFTANTGFFSRYREHK